MPIGVECLDKPRDRAQPTEDKGLSAPLADDPEACYTDRKPKFRMMRIKLIIVRLQEY